MLTAYLNSKLHAPTVQFTPYKYEKEEDLLCKLDKAVFELKQSARCWHERLTCTLMKIGFSHVRSDKCIYTNKNHTCIVGFYVDDLVIMCRDKK